MQQISEIQWRLHTSSEMLWEWCVSLLLNGSVSRSIEQSSVRPFDNSTQVTVLPRSKKYIPWSSFDDFHPHRDQIPFLNCRTAGPTERMMKELSLYSLNALLISKQNRCFREVTYILLAEKEPLKMQVWICLLSILFFLRRLRLYPLYYN